MKPLSKLALSTLSISVFIFFSACNFNQEKTPVEKVGQLSIDGVHLVDQKGKPIQLTGMSLFWSQWIGKYYNYDCIKWLKDDWKCTVVRAALAVGSGGYTTNPEKELEKIETVIDAAIDIGIYVIVDFHAHQAEFNLEAAKTFFGHISQKYGNYPNIIYEIYNEPLMVSWSEVIKPYSEAVIEVIRENDPNNIIVCGTPRWSQLVNEAALDPIDGENIAYTLHFYAGTHNKRLMEIGDEAIEKGLCIFVTEYGTTEANGDGPVYVSETLEWYEWMNKNKISHCNWSIADKAESSAALTIDADSLGGWGEDLIKPSGKLVRKELLKKYKQLLK
ncbi:MAG: glycoside hydrolase family 5 protein [Prolixibacteraceae bacterium]|jgi:endoglucanase|nr:glycoside hydrolase family 5 protein [Prolixibacteraceae bacterium]